MRRKRRGTRFSAHELDRYLQLLAKTGNQTIAADAIGRPVRSLHNKQRLEPEFAARVEAALAFFRAQPAAPAGRAPAGGMRSKRLRAAGGEWVIIRGGPHRGAQLRRARPGQLTDAALALYLRTVAATANLQLSAQSLGISPHAIADRRKRDVDFDEQVQDALKQGVANLETQLLDSALRGLAGDEEEEALDLPDEPGWPTPPVLPPMSAADAFSFFRKQQELLSRPKRWSPDRDRQILEQATARLKRLLQRMRLEVEAGVEEEDPQDKPSPEPGTRPAEPAIRRP